MLITAAFASALPDSGIPGEIVYIPEGESTITPFVDGKPKTVTVRVPADRGEEIAGRLQASLAERQKANVRPWLDFEHKAGVSAGNPTSFRYEAGKGIILAQDWSRAGKEAIEGKDFSYFSPTFLLDENGEPDGLPERGPLGSLVNEPAFRDIPRIAAKDGKPDQPETDSTMSKLIFAALAISASAENAEADAVKAIEKLKSDKSTVEAKLGETEEERDGLKEKVTTLEAAAAEERKTRAKDLVEAAVADGRIDPKDEETAKEFREKIEAGDTFAEKILAKMPKQHDGLDKPIIKAGAADKPAKDGEHAFQAEAKKLVEAKQAPTIEAAEAQLANDKPELYEAYCESIGLGLILSHRNLQLLRSHADLQSVSLSHFHRGNPRSPHRQGRVRARSRHC